MKRPKSTPAPLTVVAGPNATAVAPAYGVAVAGSDGKAIVSSFGVAYAGHHGSALGQPDNHGVVAVAGDNGMATTGDGGVAKVDAYGSASAPGNWGYAFAATGGSAIAGYQGAAATAGGTAQGGPECVAMASFNNMPGIAQAGPLGVAIAYDRCLVSGELGAILICYGLVGRQRVRVMETVGKNGIKPNVPYRLDANGKFVIAKRKKK